MEIDYEDKRVIVLKFEQDRRDNYDEITPMVTLVDKLKAKTKKPGFRREFTKTEVIIINGIWEELSKHVTLPSADKE